MVEPSRAQVFLSGNEARHTISGSIRALYRCVVRTPLHCGYTNPMSHIGAGNVNSHINSYNVRFNAKPQRISSIAIIATSK